MDASFFLLDHFQILAVVLLLKSFRILAEIPSLVLSEFLIFIVGLYTHSLLLAATCAMAIGSLANKVIELSTLTADLYKDEQDHNHKVFLPKGQMQRSYL